MLCSGMQSYGPALGLRDAGRCCKGQAHGSRHLVHQKMGSEGGLHPWTKQHCCSQALNTGTERYLRCHGQCCLHRGEAAMGTAGSRAALRALLHEGCGGAAPAACWELSQAEESLNAAQG